MLPVLFGFIKSYGLMLAISFILGMWLSIRRGKKFNLPADTIVDLVFGVLVSSILGVRFFFVLTHLGEFHPWYRVFFIWDGGLTLYGGIALSTATVWWMTRKRKIPFLVIADIFSPGVILGIGLTRLGCFMAGCCFGQPTDCACGVVFPAGSPAVRLYGEVAVHPSQLYGSLGGWLIFGMLLFMEKWSSFRGATFGRFLSLYGMSRFLVDFSRYYEPDQVMLFGWSNNQWISIGMMFAGTLVLVLGSSGKLGQEWKMEKKNG
ncbi:MAG: prolipoprotein diacylglyceryl transferase [bacterium]|nr:prolipoprotein diacylglyceryl transferase [bacterium]